MGSTVFLDRGREIEVRQLHATAAFRVGPRWSLGAGLRYLDGDFDSERRNIVPVLGSGDRFVSVPVLADAPSEVDGLGFDLGARYVRDGWGAGAVYRSEVTLEGAVRPRIDAPRLSDPVAAAGLAERLRDRGRPWRRRVELPAEAAAGAWFRPFPSVRAELDVVHTAWSDYDESGDPTGFSAQRPLSLVAGWDDTTSVRLGVEAELGRAFTLGLGAAHEPSPVPAAAFADPAAFRGDALVLAAGGTLTRGRLKVDLGLSRHAFDTRHERRLHPSLGVRTSRFASEAWVAGLTFRYGWWF